MCPFRRVLTMLWLAFGAAGPAAAQFAVCNQTLDVINLAIGRDMSGGLGAPRFETEGWWVVGPNRCANVIRDELEVRYVYVHAQDAFGQPILSAEVSLCVGVRRFRVQGETDCWSRGLIAAPFHEVDTLRNARWTLFLTRDP